MFDRQDGSAPSVTIELGHDHAIEFQRFVEGPGAVDGILSRHAIHHEVDLVRANLAVNLFELLHQRFVDGQSTGRIEDDHLSALAAGLIERVFTDLDGVLRAFVGVNGHAQLLTKDVQLVDRRRALQVSRDEHRLATFFSDQPS